MGKAGKAAASMPSYIRREASLFPLFSFSLPERALFAPSGHLPHLEEKANGRSFEPTCASNECVFAGSWRDVPYKYAVFRVLTQCTTSLKAGMSDRAPLCFPHLSFIRLEPYPARFARHLPHAGNALMREDGVLVSLSSPWGRRYSHFPPLRCISPLSFIPPVPYPPLCGTFPGGLMIRGKPAIADLRASPDLYCGDAATTILNPSFSLFHQKKNPLSQVLFAYLPFISC